MKALFLDRDGVINHDYGHVHTWDKFDFIDGSLDALYALSNLKIKIIIVTNQAGIAKGYYTERLLHKLHKKLDIFFNEKNIFIEDYFYCPHHEEGIIPKYKICCNCRKPKSGMFFKARKKYKLDLSECIMIGDKISDIIAAQSAGIKKNFLVNNHANDAFNFSNKNYTKKKNLLDCVEDICSYTQMGNIIK
ncbi:MAG: hypothetical protein CBB97_07860 [Candidatus Endolissoclinum sp. TMED37]|nr:MAG: hypothetical protein CBB97_07860 [Candidatus Endolissoclinum sp. TMED37]|tara:strand:+ start:2941 stop:3513 length:573 start_codon:yes stop_codon:yes gene_type:complete